MDTVTNLFSSLRLLATAIKYGRQVRFNVGACDLSPQADRRLRELYHGMSEDSVTALQKAWLQGLHFLD
jgi:hypothetical protein